MYRENIRLKEHLTRFVEVKETIQTLLRLIGITHYSQQDLNSLVHMVTEELNAQDHASRRHQTARF